MENQESVVDSKKLNEMKTPQKDTKEKDDQKAGKPETYDVSHLVDSLDKHRLAGMTHSARTVHPIQRHSESLCPTPGICGTPYSGTTEVTADPHGLDLPRISEIPPSPILPSPLPVHTPVHAIFPRVNRQTLIPNWGSQDEQNTSMRHSLQPETATPPPKTDVTPPDSPGTSHTVHSGTVAGRIMEKLLKEEEKKTTRQADGKVSKAPHP